MVEVADALMPTSDDKRNHNDKQFPPFRLGYVTDVEGNLEYFKSFVERSGVLHLAAEDGVTGEVQLELREPDSNYFVYGGDVVDKGFGDIRVARALVSLKRRHPDRVFLLVGNRDLNKLRFAAELSQDDIVARTIDDIPRPHWDPSAPTLRQYLEEKLLETHDDINGEEDRRNPRTIADVNTRANRLHYMLRHTLGSPNTFEFRRRELEILCQTPDVSDDDVVDSFLHEISDGDGGSLLQYLHHAQVAVAIGNTLFLHGAVDANTMKFVPSQDSKFENPPRKPAPGKVCEDLHEWIDELNVFLKVGLED